MYCATCGGCTSLPVGVDHHELDLVTGHTRSNIFMQEGHLLRTPFQLGTRHAGPKGAALLVQTEADAFKLYFTDNVLHPIILCKDLCLTIPSVSFGAYDYDPDLRA